MMVPLCSGSSLEMGIVYFIVALTTCSTNECRLQLTEKTKNRSVILWNIDIRMCQVDCLEDYIFASCLQSKKGTVMPSGIDPENHHNVLETSCGSKVCDTNQVCLEKGCTKACVQAPSFCDLHIASKTGDLAKVKVILSQGRVDNNCKEWKRRTPVLLAARGGHKDVVHLLVSTGANVSVVDDFRINILHSACQGGSVETVEYVFALDKNDINGATFCGGTPAMLAAENGHRDVVELLVGRGANVSLHDNKGNNILHFACRGGHVEVVKYILSQAMVGINSRGWMGLTPALMAAENGHRRVEELLFRKGADMSLVSGTGRNILHYACRGGNVDLVKFVLSHNIVDINSKGRSKTTPVLIAAGRGHMEMVELLVSKGADVAVLGYGDKNILQSACVGGNVELVKYLLSRKIVDINSRDKKLRTSVMLAAKDGHDDVVKLLVSKGADVSLQDHIGDNTLHFACWLGHVDLVKYVLSRNKVDINSRNRDRMTPVMTAAEKGKKEVVELLVGKGADVSLQGKTGDNILHLACRSGHVDLVKYVLSWNKVDINSRNRDRKTPVMIAAKKGKKEVVELLVGKGADVSLQDKTGDNILHLACRSGHVELVKYVLSRNKVDINSRNRDRMTPVMIAAKKGKKEVVELLVSKGADRSHEGNK